MVKFIKFTVNSIFLLFLILVILDVTYTFVKINSSPRNKIDLIINSKNENYDIVILGSSRAENHIVPEIFSKKGYKTFNFGMSGALLEENVLQLKLMLENNYKIKNIILQTDVNVYSTNYSAGTRALFMPYIHYKKSIQNQYKDVGEINKLLYIPFYRYISFEAKIGFREFFFSGLNKKTTFRENDGFDGLDGTKPNLSSPKSVHLFKKNKAYEEIKKICKKNGINLISITTPICGNNTNYFKSILKFYPEIKNYSSVIQDDKYFASCGHMNKYGAVLFTTSIVDSISIK